MSQRWFVLGIIFLFVACCTDTSARHLPMDPAVRETRFQRAVKNYRTEGGNKYGNDPYYGNQWEEDEYADYYNEDDYYESQGRSGRKGGGGRSSGAPAPGLRQQDPAAGSGTPSPLDLLSGLGGLAGNKTKKYGFMFVGAGLLFTILGMSLFFEKNLLRLGNVLFLTGAALVIGPGRTVGWFTAKQRLRATGTFAVGVFFVLIGKPVIGMIFEIFGFLNLFGNMFPLVWSMTKNMPFVRDLVGNSPRSSKGGSRQKPKRQQNYYDDDDYDRQPQYDYGPQKGYRDDDQYY